MNSLKLLQKVISDALKRVSQVPKESTLETPSMPPIFNKERFMDLKEKVAVITGGTSGIGFSVAIDLIERGVSRVIVAGRNAETGENSAKLLNEICESNQKAAFVQMDVTSKEQLKNLLYSTVSQYGKLDILMNSAGILSESTRWKQMIDINMNGVINSTAMGIKIMEELKRPGVIVNLSSIYGIPGFRPLPQLPIWSATKASVLASTLSFSRMNICKNIRCVTACMGPTDTSMWMNLAPGDLGKWAKGQEELMLKELIQQQSVHKAAEGLTLLMQYAENGSVYLVANNYLRKRKDGVPFYKTYMKIFPE